VEAMMKEVYYNLKDRCGNEMMKKMKKDSVDKKNMRKVMKSCKMKVKKSRWRAHWKQMVHNRFSVASHC